ncbi:glycerophosphoryl diester phosphodiesterase [Halostagnicola larsenii XH-48]|uniref:Glycerophosphoryl diester phosphodiesterase n=1 Tax=Halostagnicola larsenii XH-48 TaxID=797299 RepID=W0JTV0_9EURY|nr:glycerophosphodiester phosphodiesterase [Halostagnicola larsenii]AHG00443.1 glycerophosphoryl diester phosphodiesterase [Halostagnicola larsenii XH-48]
MQNRPSMVNRRRFVAGTGAALVGGTAASSTTGATTGPHRTRSDEDNRASRTDRATVIAHRGYADTYPENTVAAFELATQGGTDDAANRRRADWIELDVLPTEDGELAVFHDTELSGLTDTTGVIYETPAETVFSAEVLESGQTVPTLSEALDAIPTETGVNIDIKEGSSDVQFGRVDDPAAEREQWEWLEKVVDVATDYENELLFTTFWEGALATVTEIAPEIPVGYLLSESIEKGLAVTDEYDTAAINPPMDMLYGTPFFDDDAYESIDLVAEAHDRDLPVNVWTVNTWYEADQLLEAGVDGLILDHAEILRWSALERY